MKRFLTAATLVIVLCLSVAGGQEEPPSPYANLRCVFTSTCDDSECISEILIAHLELADRKPDCTIVVRVRSDRPLALALANANLSLQSFPTALGFAHLSRPYLFLRVKTDGDIPPPAENFPWNLYDPPGTIQLSRTFGENTELWFVPKGVALPTHSEAVQPCQFKIESFGRKKSVSKELRRMAEQLRARPAAYGLVWRFFREKTPRLNALQRQTRRILKQYGVSPDRVLIVPHTEYFQTGRTQVMVAEVVAQCPSEKRP